MDRLDRFAPPGMGASGIRSWTLGAIAISTLFSLMFLSGYFTDLEVLRQNMEHSVYFGQTMTPFADLIVLPMALFRLAPIVPFAYAAANYLYFFQESQSIYLMKRLGNPWELHIRCMVLPVFGVLLVVAAGTAVYGIYFLIYHIFTPEILLPVNQ